MEWQGLLATSQGIVGNFRQQAMWRASHKAHLRTDGRGDGGGGGGGYEPFLGWSPEQPHHQTAADQHPGQLFGQPLSVGLRASRRC